MVEINVKSGGVKGSECVWCVGWRWFHLSNEKVVSKNEKENTCRIACETWL